MSSGAVRLTRPEQRVSPEALTDLLLHADGLSLRHLPGASQEACAALASETIADKFSGEGVDTWVATEGGQLRGIALLTPTPWDSGIYGMPMGRVAAFQVRADASSDERAVLLRAVLESAEERGYVLCDFQVLARELLTLHGACEAGFRLVDTHVALVWDLAMEVPSLPDSLVSIVAARPEDAKAVGEMAAQAVPTLSRFVLDTNLPPGKAPEVFRQWAENSVLGYADHVDLARVGGHLAGYCTWRRHEASATHLGIRVANLDLTAVHPEYRRRHLLSLMVHKGLLRLQLQGFQFAEVLTHALNAPMIRACTLLGARVLSARHGLHWHANKSSSL